MIYFLSETLVPNYLTSPEVYSTYSLGKISHIGYYYWILKNKGIQNIKLVTNVADIEDGGIVLFYQADYEPKPFPYSALDGKRVTKIQVVGDTNLKVEADYYAINDQSFAKGNKFYLPFPLPVGMIKCNPSWPPKVFGCACHSFNLHSDFSKERYQKKIKDLDIDLYLEHQINRINRNIDVHFFVRNPYLHLMYKHDGSKLHPVFGYKHPNRLIQSWYMGTPSIFNDSSAIRAISEEPLDRLTANNVDEFIEQAMRLKTDKKLWDTLVYNTNEANRVYGDWEAHIISWLSAFLLNTLHYNLK